MGKEFMISGQLVDLHKRRIYAAEIAVVDGKIKSIVEVDSAPKKFILPGFIDAHIHIESSMLVPSQFSKLSLAHGTVGTISDPHEIANVLGVEGVEFMIKDAQKVPQKIYFGAPSCVPATTFETAGATITPEDISYLFKKWDLAYLSEMMNYPGVIHDDPVVLEKIKIALSFGKPVDGHLPGVVGDDCLKYISAGISTDHECFTLEEARFKVENGMKILVREGSAAKNFDALIPLMLDYPEQIMFCSDDKHPDDLIVGHINQLVERALRFGIDMYDVLYAACVHPVNHYGMDVGLLRIGDPADFIVSDDLKYFKHPDTYVDGVLVASSGKARFETEECEILNQFNIDHISIDQLSLKVSSENIRVIEAHDGELITSQKVCSAHAIQGELCSDVDQDVLKIVVVNRYHQAAPAVAFIKGFNMKKGAIASTVAHDSHNIIAVGVDDASLLKAINGIIDTKGGVNATDGSVLESLALPIAGLMSTEDGYVLGEKYSKIDRFVKDELGSTLRAPFMTLSFMALLVIPSLKLSDLGLFDGGSFSFTDIEA